MLRPHTRHHILVTTKSHSLLTIKPREIWISRHCTLAAREIIDTLPIEPSQNLVGNFSDRQVPLSKLMIIAHRVAPPDVIYAVDFNSQNVSAIETPKVNSSPSVPLFKFISNVSAAHYEPAENR